MLYHFVFHTNSRSVPSESDTSSDSDSDSSEDDDAPNRGQNAAALDIVDDDEDPVPVAASGTYFQTKHEVQEAEITVPEVDQLEAHEVLEKVGEVMNIVDHLAIVRGLPSEMLNRGSDRALDADTLLVFDDRKVMGYVRLCPSLLQKFFFLLLFFARPYHSHKTRADFRNVRTNHTAVLSNQI